MESFYSLMATFTDSEGEEIRTTEMFELERQKEGFKSRHQIKYCNSSLC